jgi:hypothetical protein
MKAEHILACLSLNYTWRPSILVLHFISAVLKSNDHEAHKLISCHGSSGFIAECPKAAVSELPK